MKLDGDSAYCQPTLVQKPNSKCVECKNNILNDTDESGKKLIKENQNGAPCGARGTTDKDVDSLSSQMNRDGLWNVSEFDCSTSDDSTNANEDEVRDFEEPYSHSVEPIGLYQKDMVFYNAKSVMECELPELIVCYKESHDNGIKDICVDKGMTTSSDKILFGNGDDERKDQSNFSSPAEEGKNITLVKENTDSTTPSARKDCCNDSTQQSTSMDPMQMDLADNDVTDATEEKFVPGSMESVEHLGTEDVQPELSANNGNGVNQQYVQILNEEAMPESPTLVSAAEESSNCSNKPIVSPSQASSAVEDSNTNKVETTSITFNLGSSAPARTREESSQNVESVNLVTQNMSKLEDSSDQVRQSLGESSFSVAGPLSGLITYSGPIAYSGSCSLRSDSSTTSTRSFAFPVLQNEWNSSPVRMKRADRRKHKGWRDGLLCCRF